MESSSTNDGEQEEEILLPSFKAMMESEQGGAKDVAQNESHEHLRLVERVLNVLDGSIEKLKVALILPMLIENPDELKKYFHDDVIDRIKSYLDKYTTDKGYDPFLSKSKNFDFQLLKAIDIICENIDFKQNLNSYLNSINETCKTLLDSIKEIRKIAEVKLTASAITETLRDKKLHQMFHENVKTKKDAGLLMAQLVEKEANLNWKILTKDGLIKKYKEDLAFKKWENSIKVKKENARSNRKMEEIWIESEQRRVHLEEEVAEAKQTYSKILTENLRKDKTLRQRRNRLLLQLQSFIQKFDTENFEKIKEIERLDEDRETMQKKYDEFMLVFNRLDCDYIILKGRKDREAKKTFENRLMMFILNRAAKVIQRSWRLVLKARRKKGKKAKKAKK